MGIAGTYRARDSETDDLVTVFFFPDEYAIRRA